MTAPVLDLAVGSALVLDGAEWTIEQLQPQYGTVVLTGTAVCYTMTMDTGTGP